MAETLATHDNVEAVKYSDNSHHLHEVNAEGKRGKQIGSDEYLRQWGKDPNERTSENPEPISIPVVEAPAELTPVTEEEKKFQPGQKVRVTKDGKYEDGWEVQDEFDRTNQGAVRVSLKGPGENDVIKVNQDLVENWQLAPDTAAEEDSPGTQIREAMADMNRATDELAGRFPPSGPETIEDKFNRLERQMNKRFDELAAKLGVTLEDKVSGAQTQVMKPEKGKENFSAPKIAGAGLAEQMAKARANEDGTEKGETISQEFTLKGRDHNGLRYLLRGKTTGGPVQINRNVDDNWKVLSDEGWFDLGGNNLEVDLLNPPDGPTDDSQPTIELKKRTITSEDEHSKDELDAQQGDTAVIRMPDGTFNKEGKVKGFVEEDGKRFVLVTMPDGTEEKVSEEDYLKWHIEAGEVVEEPSEQETLGAPETGFKARWNQLRNWIKNKRGKARDTVIAAQVNAINKANGLKDGGNDSDEGLTKEEKERKHKCRRLAFFLGGAALGAGGVALAWYLSSKHGANPFDNPGNGGPKGPGPEVIPPLYPKNGIPDFSNFHPDSFKGTTGTEAVEHMKGVFERNGIQVHGLDHQTAQLVNQDLASQDIHIASGVDAQGSQHIVSWPEGITENANASAEQGLEKISGSSVENWKKVAEVMFDHGVTFTQA